MKKRKRPTGKKLTGGHPQVEIFLDTYQAGKCIGPGIEKIFEFLPISCGYLTPTVPW